MATRSGRRIVEVVWTDLKPSDILTEKAFENAITCVMALGGSTNAIIHLIAMAGRLGLKLDLVRFDQISKRTPWLANIRPSGKYLMEDFFYAGGVRGLMGELKDLLHLDCLTVNGKTIGENLKGADIYDTDVICRREKPLSKEGGLAVLEGNLAPNGAVIKQTACDPSLVRHKGPAVVFSDYNDMAARIDDDTLEVTKNSVLVLKNAGPQGGPGMPEWGMLPIPKKLLKQGVRDMVRISDARMSGTSYGTCVLHVSPESFVGGPLALVETGDIIELDISARKLELHVEEDELLRRKKAWIPPAKKFNRGFGAIYANHITQEDVGCDFDVLEGTEAIADPEIH